MYEWITVPAIKARFNIGPHIVKRLTTNVLKPVRREQVHLIWLMFSYNGPFLHYSFSASIVCVNGWTAPCACLPCTVHVEVTPPPLFVSDSDLWPRSICTVAVISPPIHPVCNHQPPKPLASVGFALREGGRIEIVTNRLQTSIILQWLAPLHHPSPFSLLLPTAQPTIYAKWPCYTITTTISGAIRIDQSPHWHCRGPSSHVSTATTVFMGGIGRTPHLGGQFLFHTCSQVNKLPLTISTTVATEGQNSGEFLLSLCAPTAK